MAHTPPQTTNGPESLGERAYIELRQMIVRLDFAPGDVLREDELRATLGLGRTPIREALQRLALDRRCHEIIWAASGNRFLLDTLDMLYAQSDRLWHLYLADVADMQHAVDEHQTILSALRAGEGDAVAKLIETHVRGFDTQIRDAVTSRLEAPLGA